MRLGLFRLQLRRSSKRCQRIFGLRFFQRMPQRQPCPVFPFIHMARRLQPRCRPQKFLRIRLPSLRQLQSQIQIGFEHIRLRRYRFAICRDRRIHIRQTIFHVPQIKPSHITRGIVLQKFMQQRFRLSIILLFDRRFRLRQFRGRSRGIVIRNPNVMARSVIR